MGKPEVDQERIFILGQLSALEVLHHLISVPLAASLWVCTTTRRGLTHGKKCVRLFETVTIFASAKRIVARSIKNRG